MKIHDLTDKLADFIIEHKDLPDMDVYSSEGIIIAKDASAEELRRLRIDKAWEKTRGIHTDAYLYF